MNIAKLDNAIKEANRFISKAVLAKQRIINENGTADKGKYKYEQFSCTSKETAACRRASLDLTRALSDIRKLVIQCD